MLRKKQKKNPIHSSPKEIKYLEINPTKEVKDVYNESFKTLKMAVLSRDSYRFKVILTKVLMTFFIAVEETILKFTEKHTHRPKQS